MAQINTFASVHPDAKVHESAIIGPYCQIGPNVVIGENCVLQSHVIVEGNCDIGINNIFFPFCTIGFPPQDTTYDGSPTRVKIGDHNVFREYISVHRATTKENRVTEIGSNGFFMAYTHFAHDTKIGNHVVLANSVQLAGHIHIGDNTIIGGQTSLAQFIRVGESSYIGGQTGVDRDIPPFCCAIGNRAVIKGPNLVGLKRTGKSRDQIRQFRQFFDEIKSSILPIKEAVKQLSLEYPKNECINRFGHFILESKQGISEFTN